MIKCDEYKNFLKSDDALFHYTGKSVAIEHILTKKTFKLSKFSNSNDPFEYSNKWIVPSGWGDDNSEELFEKEISKIIRDNLFFISCTENFYENKTLQIEGFKRARMWAQYGDNHKGICLVFSKKRLEASVKKEESQETFKIISFGSIKYNESIDDEYQFELNPRDSAWEYLEKNAEGLFSQKPFDYRDEHEYRLVLGSTEENNLKKRALKIDLSNFIEGVILGDKFPDVYRATIAELCSKLNIQYNLLYWFEGSFNLQFRE